MAPPSTPTVYLHSARKRNQSSPPSTSASLIEMSADQAVAGGGLGEHLADPALQHPVAAQPGRASPGPVADVDRAPPAPRLDDPVDALDRLLGEIAGQHLREADPLAVHRRVDLRPLRGRRDREHVVYVELLDEVAEQAGVQELVLGQRDPRPPEAAQGRGTPLLIGEQLRDPALGEERGMEDDRVEVDAGQRPRRRAHGHVEIEVAAAPVAPEGVQVVANSRAQRVLHQVVDDEGRPGIHQARLSLSSPWT